MADDPERDTKRTTIVTTDRGGRGGAAIILLVVAIAILLAVLFFSGILNRGDESDLNVDVTTPDLNVTMPATQPPPVIVMPEGQTQPPDVNVNVTAPPPEPAPEANAVNQTNPG